MKRRHFVFVLVLAALVVSCSKKPPEGSVAGLEKVTAAIVAKDKAAFVKTVVPDQRERAGFDSVLVQDKHIAELATPDLLDVAFFDEAKSIEVDKEYVSDPTETAATLMVTFQHGDGAFAVRHMAMRKVGGEWLLDVKATIEQWYRLNGSDAFTGLKVAQ